MDMAYVLKHDLSELHILWSENVNTNFLVQYLDRQFSNIFIYQVDFLKNDVKQ